jgi:hypothetical protein
MVPRRLGRSGGLRCPTGICHRLIVPITLAFLDQNDMESLEVAELFVDRMWKSKRKIASRGSGLFECLEAPTSRNLSTPQTVSGRPSEKAGFFHKEFQSFQNAAERAVALNPWMATPSLFSVSC